MDRTLNLIINWKAVEQYFIMVLFVNPLTPIVKPWVIQSFLIFDSMNRIVKYHHQKAVEQYFTVGPFLNQFY